MKKNSTHTDEEDKMKTGRSAWEGVKNWRLKSSPTRETRRRYGGRGCVRGGRVFISCGRTGEEKGKATLKMVVQDTRDIGEGGRRCRYLRSCTAIRPVQQNDRRAPFQEGER